MSVNGINIEEQESAAPYKEVIRTYLRLWGALPYNISFITIPLQEVVPRKRQLDIEKPMFSQYSSGCLGGTRLLR